MLSKKNACRTSDRLDEDFFRVAAKSAPHLIELNYFHNRHANEWWTKHKHVRNSTRRLRTLVDVVGKMKHGVQLKTKKDTHAGNRNQNLPIRSRAPYPLGHMGKTCSR
jgi:hypothetical protein